MIQAYKICKKFGSLLAVKNFDCQIPIGSVVGLLGANGAGKSTIMKMLAGCCSPDSGQIFLSGYNLFQQPLLARSQIGYLPETSPSYPDLTVQEYLKYVISLKNSDDNIRSLEKIFLQCQLESVIHKKIQHLSKGYRQRVGLAQALIGNPNILIVDEPTAGLDPRQIQETRYLLRNLGQTKAVLLSTHILSEVEQICDRVIIIQQGEIKLDAPLKEVLKYGSLEDIYLQITESERVV